MEQNINRKYFLKTLGLGVGASILLPNCVKSAEQTKLTILHTNDVHSRIFPFPEDTPRIGGKGGFARRMALIKQIRSQEENVLLFDAGDIFQGTPYFNFYKGELEIKLMNSMGYDAATLGNHEFDNGVNELAKQISIAEFPFVNSNYELKNSILQKHIEPYKIIKKGAIKIGVIGLGIQLKGLVSEANYANINYNSPIEAGDNLAKHLKENEKCNLIVALSHLGYSYKSDIVSDIAVAQNTQHIDIIVGGHTHTFLEKPTFVKNKANNDVVITQTGWGGICLGRLDIIFDKENNKSKLISHNLI